MQNFVSITVFTKLLQEVRVVNLLSDITLIWIYEDRSKISCPIFLVVVDKWEFADYE